MLALLINKFKKILFMLIVASLMLASFTEIMHAQDNKITEMETIRIDSQYRQCEVIIREIGRASCRERVSYIV